MAVQDKDKLVSLEDLKTAYDDLDGDISDLKNTFSNFIEVNAFDSIQKTESNLVPQYNTLFYGLDLNKDDSYLVEVTNNTQSAILVKFVSDGIDYVIISNINAGAKKHTIFIPQQNLFDTALVCYVNNTSGSIDVSITKVTIKQDEIANKFRKNRRQIVEIEADTALPLRIIGEVAPRLSGTPSPASPKTIEKTNTIYVGHFKDGQTTQYDHLVFSSGVYLGEYDTETGIVKDTSRLVTFDGTEVDWRQLDGTNTFYTGVGLVKTHPCETTYGLLDYDFACTQYPNAPYDGAKFSSNDSSVNGKCCMGSPYFGGSIFAVNDRNYSTLEAWKAHLADTNLQIVYRSTRNDPTEYTISSNPPIYARWEQEKIDACYTSGNRPLFTVIGSRPLSAIKSLGNPLYGKLALYLGDSICYGGEVTSSAANGRAWAGRISDQNNMEYYNYGISGLKIAKTLNNVPYIAGWIDTLYADHPTCDYLILEGGTNDADTMQDAKIGTFDPDDFSGEYDDTTFYGALDTLFYKACNYYPKAKIGYIVAQKMGTSKVVYDRRYQFFEYAINSCKKWGIPFINLWKEGQINPNLTVYYDPTKTAQQNINAGKAYQDGQHLTPTGYDIISPKIAEWMKTL